MPAEVLEAVVDVLAARGSQDAVANVIGVRLPALHRYAPPSPPLTGSRCTVSPLAGRRRPPPGCAGGAYGREVLAALDRADLLAALRGADPGASAHTASALLADPAGLGDPAALWTELGTGSGGADAVGPAETIYRGLYQGAKGGLSRTLTRKPRTGRPLRKQRRRRDQRMPRFVAPAVLIDRRPPVIELRERLGDWEGDLVVGARSQSAVATPVDRRTRYPCLVSLREGHSAGQLRDAPSPRSACCRNGRAGASPGIRAPRWPVIMNSRPTSRTGSSSHALAVPGSEGGTNENTNGLIRRYLPKRTNLSLHTADDLRVIEHRLNNRPRKTLSWQTPAQAFAAALAL
ncbi:hypothetical protein MBT84_00080 [Streptomyces sp. MBT84]|nr:hypothetical protein [Streptomyces sp. MBT84]